MMMEGLKLCRLVCAGLASLAVGMAGISAAWADDSTLVVASFGGRFQDAERKAFFEPFERATGIKVMDVSGVSISKVETMVKTQNVEWDVFQIVPTEFLVLARDGYLEKIDYSRLDKTVMGELEPRVLNDHGVGALFFAEVIAYNTRKYNAEHHPRSWADVWDTAKFPGPRMFTAGSYEVTPIEPALLADGVPPGQLYPPDLDRAYRMLTKIRPNVVKWVDSSSAVPQALVDDEVDIGFANPARIAQLKSEGAPVDFEWNEGIIESDYWAIPKGAKHYANALKFIEFASRAESQAAMAKLLPFGPTNRRALELLPENVRKEMASYPENLKKEIFVDPQAWAAKGPWGTSYLEKNIELWNAWISNQ